MLPTGAPAWADLKLVPWSTELLEDIAARREEIKDKWRKAAR